MGELAIRRNREISIRQYPTIQKAEKQTGGTSKVTSSSGFTVSETLQRLMSKIYQSEGVRESYRTLQTGEAVLAEVKDALSNMSELAQKSAGDGSVDRDALQAELESLRDSIGRMLQSAAAGDTRLFLDDGGIDDSMEALLFAVMGGSGKSESLSSLPDWLTQGLGNALSAEQLLSGLGLDKSASGAEILAAVMNNPPGTNAAADFLSAMYLGAVIANTANPGNVSPESALGGLQQFISKVAEGVSPDEALSMLTGGLFTSFEDLQTQITEGTAPGLQNFLTGFLLTDSSAFLAAGDSLLNLLANLEGANLDLLMGILDAMQTSAANPDALLDALASDQTVRSAEAAGTNPPQAAVQQFGNVQVAGRDLSGVSFNAATGELTIGGTADVAVQGMGTGPQSMVITGSGTVTLQDVELSRLTVDSPAARLVSVGESTLETVTMRQHTTLTLDGSGLMKIGVFHGDKTNTLHINSGAVAVQDGGKAPGTLPVPVVLDGPASLAAQAASVTTAAGKAAEPFDIIWKTLLPGWSHISSMELDGKQARMMLSLPEAARIWLAKGDGSQGSPVHTVIVHGKDEAGQSKTRYAYLHWNQQAGAFEETELYPNPFAVVGGELGRDWWYEEETHTLCILSNQVTGISGGAGTDANRTPFSGRVALADGIGALELALGGVVCEVSEGAAFYLGRENNVTLLLQSGTENRFESGGDCAGISLGDGTSLRIDCPDVRSSTRNPLGTLTAAGGNGGAGIGRDSGASRDQTSQILIYGGAVTASGAGGGAGIGAGKHSYMGAVTILGGTVEATGGNGGGAGIGGALGAPVGNISIRGGKITAVATYQAAAIGAGVQGACGDILITGTARILKAMGGNPGADIGGCLFGHCGNVQVSGGANIGSAKLWTRTGVSLKTSGGSAGDSVTLPQFRLSPRALQLDGMSLSTRERALEARMTLEADLRWVSRIQEAYNAMYGQVQKRRSRGARNVPTFIHGAEDPVRDSASAGTLLDGMRESISRQSAQAMQTHSGKNAETVRHLLQA